MEAPQGGEQRSNERPPKPLEPAQEQTEVVAGAGEPSVDAIAVASAEVIAAHLVLGRHMPNDLLDGGAAVHLASDGRSNPANLAADPDAEPLCVVVAAIAFVDI